MNWTDEQKDAILKSKSNILVAAGAGSGKTAVLVERIINKIINEKTDIDRILVVTFTNAAAAEMRERILNAIYRKIDESKSEEEQANLQKQVVLLNKASICTIDSFCLDVIRNNFFEIDVSPNFRIGDSTEMELLKQEVLEDLFEEKYEMQDTKFQELIKAYTDYRDDMPLKELILKIFSYISSSPYPRKWLDEQIEKFNIKDVEIDFAKTTWGEILLEDIKEEVEQDIIILQNEARKLEFDKENEMCKKVLENDVYELNKVLENTQNWDKVLEIANKVDFIKWPTKKAPEVKDLRTNIKTKFKDKINKFFVSNSKEAIQDINNMYQNLVSLKELIFEFEDRFQSKKKERNILDFTDIEHLALKILVQEKEDGKHQRSDVAKRYQEKFVEIAIDEYQDSNLVQEYILTSVSRGNNMFMVGDVKQSIYKFRQAMPELFLGKYKNFSLKNANEKGLKIQLFKNFRSRKNVLDFTNLIFEKIMSEKLGEINYTEEEYLNLGSKWDIVEDVQYEKKIKNEIAIIDLKEEKNEIEEDEEENQNEEPVQNIQLEAKFVANKIKELVENKFQVYDLKEKAYRDIKYKDIVILFRSPKGRAPIFENELIANDIPVFSDMSAEYLDSIEIDTIMSVLKIIDNPMQDIPLVTVMRSSIGKFTDNDLVEIRLADKNSDFYTALLKAKISVSQDLREKIDMFLSTLEKWRKEQEYLALDELIWTIYEDTGFLNYVGILPNGGLRQANLKMLFERAKQYETASFKGLFNFIKFIEKMNISSGDFSSAKMIGENENVVRIMSIHKSKGLEFPVVFLSSASTKFNLKDLYKDILLNQELGLGIKYIDYDLQIKYDTLTKLAIQNRELTSIISEEMRILYVALTRAKEKLYITGISNNYEKELSSKRDLIESYKKETKINKSLIKKYKNYLDWIILVYLSEFDKMNEVTELNVYKKEEILKDAQTDQKEKVDVLEIIEKGIQNVSKEDVDAIKKALEFEYEFKSSIEIPSKTSITEVAHKNKEINKDSEKQSEDIEFPLPKFLINDEEEKITPAKKGTIVHLCMKKLDFSKEYNLQDIKDLILDLKTREIITEKEAKSVDAYQILQFTKAKLWEELKNAKEVYKEEPFYINIPANEIYDKTCTDNILAQGIIDLYYINSNNELILLDYKTDFVHQGEEEMLKQRHTKQLNLYKEALENALNRKVDKIYIYSTVLGKEILI